MKKICVTLTRPFHSPNKAPFSKFKQGDQLTLFVTPDGHLLGRTGIFCSKDGRLPYYEIPLDYLSFDYEGKEYRIFMTEYDGKTTNLYSMEGSFDRLELLTRIQKRRFELLANGGLKISLQNRRFYLQSMSLCEIQTLF